MTQINKMGYIIITIGSGRRVGKGFFNTAEKALKEIENVYGNSPWLTFMKVK